MVHVGCRAMSFHTDPNNHSACACAVPRRREPALPVATATNGGGGQLNLTMKVARTLTNPSFLFAYTVGWLCAPWPGGPGGPVLLIMICVHASSQAGESDAGSTPCGVLCACLIVWGGQLPDCCPDCTTIGFLSLRVSTCTSLRGCMQLMA